MSSELDIIKNLWVAARSAQRHIVGIAEWDTPQGEALDTALAHAEGYIKFTAPRKASDAETLQKIKKILDEHSHKI